MSTLTSQLSFTCQNFQGSPSVTCTSAGSKVILRAHVEEGEPENEASCMYVCACSHHHTYLYTSGLGNHIFPWPVSELRTLPVPSVSVGPSASHGPEPVGAAASVPFPSPYTAQHSVCVVSVSMTSSTRSSNSR